MKRSALHHLSCPLILGCLLNFSLISHGQDAPPRGAAGGRGAGFGAVDPNATLATQMISQGDKDADQKITGTELGGLAEAWFDKLDPEKAGTVTQDNFTQRYGSLIGAADPGGQAARGAGRRGGPGGFGGGGNPGLGLFLAADIDKNGTLTREELKSSFAGWFAKWDEEKSGSLSEEKLLSGLTSTLPRQDFGARGGRGAAGGRGGNPDAGADFSPKPPVQALSPEEQLKHLQLPPGYRLELVLSEPDIMEPVVTAFDGNGRMFVVELRSYMQDVDGTKEHDPVSRISMHEDTNGDGKYERHTVFVDKLVLPRFVLPLHDHSILTMETDANDIFKYTDTDGDGVSDKKELFFNGGGRRGNLEHQQSGMVWALDNWIYTTYNAFRLRWTPTGVLKEETGPNGGQWGLTQDDHGRTWYVNAGNERGPVNFQTPILYGAFSAPGEKEEGFDTPWPVAGVGDYQGGMLRVRLPDQMLNHFTAPCGPDIYRGDRLPAEMRGDLFFAEPVGRLIRRAKVVSNDGLTQLRNAHPQSEFIRSTDLLFRPVNLVTAPDGTLYITDMYRGIIQEGNWTRPGSYLRRKVLQYEFDKIVGRGRIWRVVHESMAPSREQPRMLNETPAQLVRHLEHANGWWRDSAQRLLVLKQDKSVVPALQTMARSSKNEFGRIHAIWTLEGLNALDASLVRETMKDANPNLRVHAIRVSESLAKAGDKSFDPEVRAMVKDAHPNVAIQSMLTVSLREPAEAPAVIRSALASSASRGVQELGGQLLQPRGGGRGGAGAFGGLQLSASERILMQRGSAIYQELCFACHGNDGKGSPLAGAPDGTTLAPSMVGSPRVLGHRDYVINAVMHGVNGEIDGKTYTALMVPMGSNTDEWLAAVSSYVRNSFGNSASFITADQVAKVRSATQDRKEPWMVDALVAATPAVLSYQPDWKITASHNAGMAEYAINSTGAIRWDTGAPQQPGMWFQIELPKPATLTEIELVSARSAGPNGGDETFPRAYSVQVSMDGKEWSAPVAAGQGQNTTTLITFSPVTAKAVRITQTATVENAPAWSIQKTRLYAPGTGRITSASAAPSNQAK